MSYLSRVPDPRHAARMQERAAGRELRRILRQRRAAALAATIRQLTRLPRKQP